MTMITHLDAFRQSLAVRNLSARTIGGYSENVTAFARWAEEAGLPTEPEDVTRAHIEQHLAALREDGLKPSTIETRYRGLRQFFGWAEDYGHVDENPMARMKAPKVPERVQKMVSDEELAALRAAIPETKHFDDIRDRALLETLTATGMRREELASLHYPRDVDEARRVLIVRHGKGDKQRETRYGDEAAKWLGRYLRARRKHKHADRPELWLGWGGPLGASGIRTMLRRLSARAGVKVTAHEFRRRFVDTFLSRGGNPYDLQQLMGWSDATVAKMIRRYGAERAQARALDEYDRVMGAA